MLHQGESDKALAAFTRSLELNPANAEAFAQRASAFRALARQEESLADLNQAVLLDPRHTAAYCNQRATLHFQNGEYEQALADYAIVLQLDPANLTALLGREQALEALRSPARQREQVGSKNGAAHKSRKHGQASTRKRSRDTSTRTEGAAAPATRIHPAGVETQPHPPVEAEFIPGDEEQGSSAKAEICQPMTEPRSDALPHPGGQAPGNETLPLEAVPEKTAEEEYLQLNPLDLDTDERPHGPTEQHAARAQQRMEAEDRARRWEELRFRERQRSLGIDPKDGTYRPVKTSDDRGAPFGKLIKVAAVLLVVSALAGAGYFLVFQNRESRLDAVAVWQEFDRDTKGANLKYKGKFVRVTGILKEYSAGQSSRFFFEMPENAKWGIEFTLARRRLSNCKLGRKSRSAVASPSARERVPT